MMFFPLRSEAPLRWSVSPVYMALDDRHLLHSSRCKESIYCVVIASLFGQMSLSPSLRTDWILERSIFSVALMILPELVQVIGPISIGPAVIGFGSPSISLRFFTWLAVDRDGRSAVSEQEQISDLL